MCQSRHAPRRPREQFNILLTLPKTAAQNKNMAPELEQAGARADLPETDQAWHDFERKNIVILR
jgi:acetyl esterase/lipase